MGSLKLQQRLAPGSRAQRGEGRLRRSQLKGCSDTTRPTVTSTSIRTKSSSSTTTTPVAIPAPSQSDVAVQGEECWAIANDHGNTLEQF